jgi:uncharacterized protein
MERIYDNLLKTHFAENRQMAFLSGPRQVGKTTTSKTGVENPAYLNWDNQASKQAIVAGPDRVAELFDLHRLGAVPPRVIFDEIHKYGKWKSFLKGYFDDYGQNLNTVVTGSARLNIYKRGGDSLMGRYFLYRMHPLTVGEILSPKIRDVELGLPAAVSADLLDQLVRFGGFPEPFLKADTRFYNRWRRLRTEQLFREDLRDLTNVQEIGQLEIMAEILRHQAGQVVNLSNLAREVNVSVDTTRRWMSVLESLYYCFTVRPWFKNVPKSLRKQPKVYLRDWSLAPDGGARIENLVASHLSKAVHFWTDMGFGEFSLHYLRDNHGREVDFAVAKDSVPWFLVEVKSSARRLSKSLKYFQNTTSAPHAVQLDWQAPFVEADCFTIPALLIAPACTFLSQLV